MNARLNVAAGLLGAAALTPCPASAYALLDEGGACPGGIHWTADQDLSVNTSNAADLTEAVQLAAAMSEVANRVDQVGGQWFDYNDPYGAETSNYSAASGVDGDGVNEVGLADLSGLGSGVIGYGPSDVNLATCEIIEADVFLDSGTTWDYLVPSDGNPTDDCDVEECYFDAGVGSPRYVRTTMLHELGHTLGLAHSDHSYSFMNYNVRPWSNRDDDKRIEFLPDDREALRYLYPATSTETDAAVMVTYYDPADITNDASNAKLFCRPSTGTALSPSSHDEYCGVESDGSDGSTDVCPNDYLYVRYALANYGTASLTVSEQLWFSTNTTLNNVAGSDKKSTTAPAAWSLGAQSSYAKGRKFKVPTTVSYNTDYYPIMFISSYANEESQQNNWIPLRAKIHVKTFTQCSARPWPPS